ncbi:hypothetical protein UFOVP1672_57 [uncultured Caudovirales phage]|uniref:Uncharacterized protein n=1 Tax=uncultured Caudovirales phage TaxID=2100421 RepID=A0A6J5T6S7_9CAUD|nr:hypothetical protein UFOVP988_79 [uncultured Caudovirales phage]CAB4211090.1 hypothetical protein UFOVP1425_79 [uncultured Caudovirales phage]CAB4223453.1 hypothetical protein UFOVP1672_57 [uncultured Caudovirales phage]
MIERVLDWWASVEPWILWPVSAFYETRLGAWWCERQGHDDVWWFNLGGYEPDMHCKRCGKDLG